MHKGHRGSGVVWHTVNEVGVDETAVDPAVHLELLSLLERMPRRWS